MRLSGTGEGRGAGVPSASVPVKAAEDGAGTDDAVSDSGRSEDTTSGPGYASCCIICMDAVATVGFRHGFTVHKCVCHACARTVVSRADTDLRCPLCRALVQDVLLVY